MEEKCHDIETPPIARTSFDVKLTSPIMSAGTYRVFVERSDLLFIQLEGGKMSVIGAVAPLFGPVGSLVPTVLWLLGRGKNKVKKERLETGDPELLLRENEANFKLNAAEIRDAAIEGPKLIMESGKAGRLNLCVRHGEKIKCEFADAAQMKRAIELLVPLLNVTLLVNVEWNKEKGRFEKKKVQRIQS